MAILYFMEVKMTSLIEKIVAIVAPHRCLGCGNENNILCTDCLAVYIPKLSSLCVLCGKPGGTWQPCKRCQVRTSLGNVWAAGAYQGVLAELIKRYKFERARAAHEPLGRLLAASLPVGDWDVVPVPTATNHIRQRGYDHTLLIARSLARQRHLPVAPLLRRAHDSQQVGANRRQRAAQVVDAFYVAGRLPARPILLVDDVCTTGATLVAAADALRSSGAIQVDAMVCAWRAPQLRYNGRIRSQ